MALGTEAQPARLLKRRPLLGGENANEPTAFRIIFAQGGDRVGRAERVLAGNDDIAVRGNDEVEWA
jgi:hypothetical protein